MTDHESDLRAENERLKEENAAAHERAAALADALECKLMDFVNHGDELTLKVTAEEYRSMSAALRRAQSPNEDHLKAWPMSVDQEWRDGVWRKKLDAAEAALTQLREAVEQKIAEWEAAAKLHERDGRLSEHGRDLARAACHAEAAGKLRACADQLRAALHQTETGT